MHTVTDLKQSDRRMQLWAWYNHFAIWSLIAMSVTGVYLWLASRPRYRIAHYSFLGGGDLYPVICGYPLTYVSRFEKYAPVSGDRCIPVPDDVWPELRADGPQQAVLQPDEGDRNTRNRLAERGR